MQIKAFTFNEFQENTYVVSNQKSCVIIDPGCYQRHEQETLKEYISTNNLKPLAVLNTHCHIDHVLGNAFVCGEYEIPLYIHELDLTTLNAVSNYAHLYGFDGYQLSPQPDFFLEDKEFLDFDGLTFQVIFGPGHAPGHVAFYNEESSICVCGDILFKGSFGRVDLPGGNIEDLKKSIHERFFILPEKTKLFCGHGPSTDIKTEKHTNYILQY